MTEPLRDSVPSQQSTLNASDFISNHLRNWTGRTVAYLCPRGNYTHGIYCTIQATLGVVVILSAGALMIGAIWEDSLDKEQKVIIVSTSYLTTTISACGAIANYVIFKNQPQNISQEESSDNEVV